MEVNWRSECCDTVPKVFPYIHSESWNSWSLTTTICETAGSYFFGKIREKPLEPHGSYKKWVYIKVKVAYMKRHNLAVMLYVQKNCLPFYSSLSHRTLKHFHYITSYITNIIVWQKSSQNQVPRLRNPFVK